MTFIAEALWKLELRARLWPDSDCDLRVGPRCAEDSLCTTRVCPRLLRARRFRQRPSLDRERRRRCVSGREGSVRPGTPRRASEPEAASRATRCGLCRKPRVRTLPWARARKRLLFRDAKMASCGTCEQPARFHDSVSRWRASSERGQERAARPGLSQCFERWSRRGLGADLRSCTLRLGLCHRPKPLSPGSLEDSAQDAGNSHPLLSSS